MIFMNKVDGLNSALQEILIAIRIVNSFVREKYEKNNSTIQNLKGMIYVSLGKLEDAKTLFNDILKKYPNVA